MLKKAILLGLLITCGSLPAFAQTDGARIRFARKATSATVKGAVAKGGPDFYLVGAKAGQTMIVKTTGKVSFGIDSPAARLTEDDGNTTWSGELTADGDYKIRVYSAGGAQDYSLTISISAARKTGGSASFYTSGYYSFDDMDSESASMGYPAAIFLTQSDSDTFALVNLAQGEVLTPILVEASLADDMRTVEFKFSEEYGSRKFKGVVSAAGLKMDDGRMFKRQCANAFSDISTGSESGDAGGTEIFLMEAGDKQYALVTIAEGVMRPPVLVETKMLGKTGNKFEFTLPTNENGMKRKFTGTISRTKPAALNLNESGNRSVLKAKCYQ